ncbi:uncharacterized protein K02A2.6-like [Stylophora pistillata]|uniref:Uncharacterized protein K02A2.6 n=1 Tax=Stylophora pistillata TaxID=50429 RepID=A0A2B4RGZ6_STYPI|nr:uncharacterized protein K02A2.6-like [Stylophora pistillata]PFX16891.1 Uncharacterized protein K02A2.6 [Stylophora pistillata]
MPSTLWQTTLPNAHGGHQGIVWTKQMVRERVWWPGITHQVETMVKAYLPCQSVAGKSTAEPLRPTVMPDKPWQEVHIDLCGPFPTGESLVVCEDACTRWPEVVLLRSTTSAAIIGHLLKIFAVHGLPDKVVTDKGANLVSEEFEEYLATHGIQHRKVTPYWPQANGKDQQAKQRTQVYADKRNRASPSDMNSGDKLLLQQARQNKLSTLYDSQPYSVIQRRGPSLILQRTNGQVFMRNVSQVRKLHQNTAVREEGDYGMDFDLPQAMNPPRAAEQDTRRSARVRRAPTHLRDYQLH